MKKNIFILFCLIVISSSSLFAFEWPQQVSNEEAFESSFGQLRGGTMSPSIVFSKQENATAIGSGKIIAVITEHDDDMGWFESPLGNTVIVAHENQIDSIYSNLIDEDGLNDLEQTEDIDAGSIIGTAGSSGWKANETSGLEFQIIDVKNQKVINPRIIMPKLPYEQNKAMLSGIQAVSSKGEVYNFLIRRTLPAGTYKIYKDRQVESIPYKSTVTLNGIATETITFDTLQQFRGRVCASKNSFYTVENIYPDDKKQYLAEVTLTNGKTNLAIILTDLFENEISVSYALDIN